MIISIYRETPPQIDTFNRNLWSRQRFIYSRLFMILAFPSIIKNFLIPLDESLHLLHASWLPVVFPWLIFLVFPLWLRHLLFFENYIKEAIIKSTFLSGRELGLVLLWQILLKFTLYVLLASGTVFKRQLWPFKTHRIHQKCLFKRLAVCFN